MDAVMDFGRHPTVNAERLYAALISTALITSGWCAGSVRGSDRPSDRQPARATAPVPSADGGGRPYRPCPQGARQQLAEEAPRPIARSSEWLLFLHPETALEPGWEVEAEIFHRSVGDGAARRAAACPVSRWRILAAKPAAPKRIAACARRCSRCPLAIRAC
jgi:hypothetical protein